MSFLYEKTPASLQELFKDALINNTFREEDILGTLKMTNENSFSYLYRLQRNMVTFQQFHFQTRERDLEMSKSDIDNRREDIDEIIEGERPPEEEPIDVPKLEKEKDKLVEAEYGDYFLSRSYRVDMIVNFDLTTTATRKNYRSSDYFNTEFTFNNIIRRPDLFRYIPIITVDGKTYFDFTFELTLGGELLIHTNFKSDFIYTEDHKYVFHDTHIMFVDNLYADRANLSQVVLKYYSEKRNRIPLGYWPNPRKRPGASVDGMYLTFIRFNTNTTGGKKNKDTGFYPFQETRLTDTYFEIDYDEVCGNMVQESTSIDFVCIFFHHMKKYTPYYGVDIQKQEHGIPLLMLQKSENEPYAMPIPEVNLFLLKENDDHRYLPNYFTDIKMHYPNIYEIVDKDVSENHRYKLYYFYAPDFALKYTPLHDFYYRYLKMIAGEDIPIEKFVNMIKNGEPLTFSDEKEHIADAKRFNEVFNWVLGYKEEDQEYHLQDFLLRETWAKKPINYQTNEMKQYILHDFNVLRNYARKERTIGNVYHLYANTIDLDKRFRRSTNLEFRRGMTFFKEWKASSSSKENALLVVSNEEEDFDYEDMIRIRDFEEMEPSKRPSVGDYIELIDDSPKYVFLMKQNANHKPRKLRIFVDGAYIIDYYNFARKDSEYIYLPASKIKDDSYIMIEEMEECTFLTTLTFDDISEIKEINVIKSGVATPYVTDLYLLDDEGFEMPTDQYTVTPIIKESEYSIAGEDGNDQFVHAEIQNFKLQLKNPDYIGKPLEVRIFKEVERYTFTLDRRSWPRFTLHDVRPNRQISHIEIWHNGLLVPDNLYRVENYRQFGIYRIQMLKEFVKGDEFIIEFSPYTHKTPVKIDFLKPGGVMKLAGLIDKPACIDYYDFYINGKRLGLPHVYQVGHTGVTFTNLTSTHYLEIRERERDDEYFGFDIDKTSYYYSVLDLIDDSFVTPEDRERILKEIIDNQKDPRTEIRPNTDDEEHIWVENLSEVEEQAKIFYYEDFLPKVFINPDELQFNKEYFKLEYPDLASVFLRNQENVPDANGEILMMDPDINATSPPDKQIIMMTGETNH